MKRVERKWMYERLDGNKKLRVEYANGVREFLNFAKQQEEYKRSRELRCPCMKCKNLVYLNEAEIKRHLAIKGFRNDYYNWTCHGEPFFTENSEVVENRYREMVEDALLDNVNQIREEALNPGPDVDEVHYEAPNPQVSSFFEMLENAGKPVYEGSEISLLQSASRLLTLKCEYNLPHKCVDGIASLISDIIPKDNVMTRNFYETKKVLKALQLPHEKIDVCVNGCMLYWDKIKTEHKEECDICHEGRYKIVKGKEKGKRKKMTKGKGKDKRISRKILTYFPLAPRLQRLYATKHIAGEMSWHHENPRPIGTMTHPSDGEAWKHFDNEHPDFASEPRNVRLGLCTDGFSPYGQFGKSYSCWPVIVTPYNLPPWLCMKKQFMFLSLIVPGPKNPKSKMDVYLQPLIHELKELWDTGVYTYDVSKKQNFQLKAALMWTINDFPAYGMLSGWGTQGKHACPYCTDNDPKSFWLEASGKMCWFDCHRKFLPIEHPFRWGCRDFRKDRPNEPDMGPHKLSGIEVWNSVKHLPKIVDATDLQLKRQKDKKEGWWKQSIFWELPYWKTLLIRHNLDVMHIEKNFFEQVINTVMDVPKKTSFGPKAKIDLKKYCKSRKKQSNKFVLDKDRKKVLCQWVSSLKFPDGYASDLSRCVDQLKLKLHGMKSHDCHVFMERLLPVAFKHLLPKNVWSALTEISQFFRDLCASNLKIDAMTNLENKVAEIICKLEKIFPPSFFNSMEHLPVHLPYEAKVGGPVQYRWMYPFERFLNHLKQKIGNKARIEGSICNAYLLEEISNFCSLYFEEHIETKAKNLDLGKHNQSDIENSSLPEVFQDHKGSTTGKCTKRFLEDNEYEQAHFYILSNCEVLRPYELEFEAYILYNHPEVVSADEVWKKYEKMFPKWLKDQVHRLNDPFIKALAMGPSRRINTWKRYCINGYKFRAFRDGIDLPKATTCNGVSMSSTEGVQYYGTLNEVMELTYTSNDASYKTVLFKCDWIDNSRKGLQVHDTYKLIDVDRTQEYPSYDPFVLSYQVEQVCYVAYPSTKKDNRWSAVFKIKPRSHIDVPVADTVFQEEAIGDQQISSNVQEGDENEEEDEFGDEDQNVNGDSEEELDETEGEEDDEGEDGSKDDEEEEDGRKDDEEDEDEDEDGLLFSEDDSDQDDKDDSDQDNKEDSDDE